MRKRLVAFAIAAILLVAARPEGTRAESQMPDGPRAGAGFLAEIPPINGWLLRRDGSPACWLGIKYFGRTLREPINVVIIDPYSATETEAMAKLMRECAKAGYRDEIGHSAGYRGEINGLFYRQIPEGKHMAFANKDFFQTNNHGRIMGPAVYRDSMVFIAAFSTERPTMLKGFEHLFVSFNRARDDFCSKMDARSDYRIVGLLSLGNTLDTGAETTADHDGKAVVLQALR